MTCYCLGLPKMMETEREGNKEETQITHAKRWNKHRMCLPVYGARAKALNTCCLCALDINDRIEFREL